MSYGLIRRKVALIRNRVFGSGKPWAAERIDTSFVEKMAMWQAGRDSKLDDSLSHLLTVPQDELEQIVVRYKVEREE